MPSFIYKGKRYIQEKHAKYCKKCKTTVESTYIHHFVECPCGAVAVDGGIATGNRFLGNLEDMEDRSVWRTEGKPYEYISQSALDELHAERIADKKKFKERFDFHYKHTGDVLKAQDLARAEIYPQTKREAPAEPVIKRAPSTLLSDAVSETNK
jgi:hypothetical protein